MENVKEPVEQIDSAGNSVETKPKSKWQDKDFLRVYYREKRRSERGGLKKHPYKLDDGRLWSEVYPYCGFATIEEARAYKAQYRKPPPPRPKMTCTICGQEIYVAKKELHYKSEKHKFAVELLKNHNVIQS